MNEAACGLHPGPWREHDPPPKLPFTVSGLGTGRPSYADPPARGCPHRGGNMKDSSLTGVKPRRTFN